MLGGEPVRVGCSVVYANAFGEETGFVRLIRRRDCSELATLGVLRSCRGSQVGSELFRYLLREAPALHVVAVIPSFFAWLGFAEVDDSPQRLEAKVGNEAMRRCGAGTASL